MCVRRDTGPSNHFSRAVDKLKNIALGAPGCLLDVFYCYMLQKSALKEHYNCSKGGSRDIFGGYVDHVQGTVFIVDYSLMSKRYAYPMRAQVILDKTKAGQYT